MANNRLPCPTDVTLTESSTVFGTEGVLAGVCTTGSTYDGNGNRTAAANPGPTANFTTTLATPSSNTNIPGGTAVVEGGVPVRTLNLSDEFAVDGWGRKIAYAVWAPITGTSAFVNYGIYSNCGAINVHDAAATTRTTLADYVLLSYGANGHGGYLPNGTRMNAGSLDADEQTNCHCSATASNNAYSATYVQKDVTVDTAGNSLYTFDDIVRFRSAGNCRIKMTAIPPAAISPALPASG